MRSVCLIEYEGPRFSKNFHHIFSAALCCIFQISKATTAEDFQSCSWPSRCSTVSFSATFSNTYTAVNQILITVFKKYSATVLWTRLSFFLEIFGRIFFVDVGVPEACRSRLADLPLFQFFFACDFAVTWHTTKIPFSVYAELFCATTFRYYVALLARLPSTLP